MDRISGLPNEVLSHTLSFLSSKEAPLTSHFSKRWRDLFTFTQNPRFEDNDNDFVDSNVPISFIHFVDRVLSTSGNSPVRRFSLKYRRNVESARINLWISNVLSRCCGDGVLELLDLDVIVKGGTPLPLAVFTCKKLVKLKLGRGFFIPVVPETASLPALKILFLDRIRFCNLDNRPFETLISACRVLEELTILGEEDDHGKLCRNVSCPTLERLTIDCKDLDGFLGYDYKTIVTFDTPCLTYLDYRAFLSDEYPIVNLASLVEAKINLKETYFRGKSNPTNLIMGLRNVEILNLSEESCQIFGSYSEAIPVMENLSRLFIENFYDVYWESLPLLLNKSPNLETLVIKGLASLSIGDFDGYEGWSGYSFPLSCPVKVLKIKKFCGSIGALRHLKCLLENLPCLELVKVVSSGARDEKAKTQLAADLLMLPGASKIQLEFY